MSALRSAVACAALALLAPRAAAHDGPPFPILVDESVGGHALSVWADPDVGQGTFYVYLPDASREAAPLIVVRVAARPLDGSSAETSSAAEIAPPGVPYQRVALLDLPRSGAWSVRFVLESPAGSASIATEVEVTPPGAGKLDLLWFSAPFFLLGCVWLKAFFRRRALESAARPC